MKLSNVYKILSSDDTSLTNSFEYIQANNNFENDSLYLLNDGSSSVSSGTAIIVDEIYQRYTSDIYYHAILYSNGVLEQYGSFISTSGTSRTHAFPIPFSDNRIYLCVAMAINSNTTKGVNVDQCEINSGTGTNPWGGTSGGNIGVDNLYHCGRCAYGFRLTTTSADRQYHYYARGTLKATSLDDYR